MSIFVDADTRVLVQGMGRTGQLHTSLSLEFGTPVVGGVTPGKGGGQACGLPIFDSVRDAVRETGANASVVFVPPPGAGDAILEAAEAGIGLIVAITEHVPVRDMVRVRHAMRGSASRLIGPNCPGVLDPSLKVRIGIAPYPIFKPGTVGVVSRSGTLTYEAVGQLSALDIGQSTCIGIGGDPVNGTSFIDCLENFEKDDATRAVVMIGEIGGSAEEEAAEFVRSEMTKPVVAFIAGATAPPGKRMGHAGAIVSGGRGTAAEKREALEKAGIPVAASPALMAETLREACPEAR
ncbi:MAG: succinate--CoA ligase subunit alpha [Proteobacteria bacterium]|nr:succinate--CoA ligase subunit alpha [Pseudomonadota bacterium]